MVVPFFHYFFYFLFSFVFNTDWRVTLNTDEKNLIWPLNNSNSPSDEGVLPRLTVFRPEAIPGLKLGFDHTDRPSWAKGSELKVRSSPSC